MPAARDFLIRGLLAGLLAGLVAFGVAYVVGEPSVNAAIAIEEAGGAGHSHADGAAGSSHSHGDAADDGSATEVPRSLQSTVGLLTGTTVLGVTLGGLVGVLSALAVGRFGRLGPRASTLLVTGVGFVAAFAVPFVGYPPNPPAVGQGETIGYRTALYFILLAISLIAAVTSVLVGRWAATRIGAWYAGLAAVGGYLVVVVASIALMPSYDEIPDGFPAALLYAFRGGSFLTQLALWSVLGVVLAELVHRLIHPRSGRSGAVAGAAAPGGSAPAKVGR